jgi:hypothetical protein
MVSNNGASEQKVLHTSSCNGRLLLLNSLDAAVLEDEALYITGHGLPGGRRVEEVHSVSRWNLVVLF